jgi:hypothetical protein
VYRHIDSRNEEVFLELPAGGRQVEFGRQSAKVSACVAVIATHILTVGLPDVPEACVIPLVG